MRARDEPDMEPTPAETSAPKRANPVTFSRPSTRGTARFTND
jgi:hypothetical protein